MKCGRPFTPVPSPFIPMAVFVNTLVENLAGLSRSRLSVGEAVCHVQSHNSVCPPHTVSSVWRQALDSGEASLKPLNGSETCLDAV